MNAAAVPLTLAILAGGLIALQAPTNAVLARAAGSPVTAAFISFLVGSAALGVMALLLPSRQDAPGFSGLPWYIWIGGFYGAFFVAVAAYGAPRIGIGVLLVAAIAGQLLMAVALDHFGALGLPKHPASMTRIAGVALVFLGALLVRRG
jgi:transporter family-2 protein